MQELKDEDFRVMYCDSCKRSVLPPCRKHQQESWALLSLHLQTAGWISGTHQTLRAITCETSVNFGFEMDIKHWILLFLHVCMAVEHWCGSLLIQFQVSERCSSKGRLSMRVKCFQASFLNVSRSHSLLGQAGVHRHWFSLLKHAHAFCTSLATGELGYVFVQWSGWYSTCLCLCLSAVPLF